MESFSRNKIFSDVFVRYLKNRFGWEYISKEPIGNNDSDADIVLESKKQKRLLLQLKELKKHERTEKLLSGKSKLSIFNIPFFNLKKIVKEYEKKYAYANELILLIHLCDGYFIPSDKEVVDKNEFTLSTFKGIYLISPEYELFGDKGKEFQREFIISIKDAFTQ